MNQRINIEANEWKSPSLYIGDLSKSVTETDLEEIFQSFGNINSIKICRNWKTGAPLGYGFVNFQSTDDATRALQALNYTNIKGKQCRLMWSTKRAKTPLKEDKAANIYVKGIPKDFTNKQLNDMFSPYGTVLSAKVATNSSNITLGYGYVSFAKYSSAALAIEKVNGSVFKGSVVSVEPFVEKFKRNGGGGGLSHYNSSNQSQTQESGYSTDEYPSPLPHFGYNYNQLHRDFPEYKVPPNINLFQVPNQVIQTGTKQANYFDNTTMNLEKRRGSITSNSTAISNSNKKNEPTKLEQDLLGWKEFDLGEESLDFAPLQTQKVNKLSASDIDEVIEELNGKLLSESIENSLNLFD